MADTLPTRAATQGRRVHLTLAPSSTFGDHHSAPCSSSGSKTVELLSGLSRVGVVIDSSFASSLSAPSTFSTEAYSLGESWLADESVLTSITTLTLVARLVSAGPDTSPFIICTLLLEICFFCVRRHKRTRPAEDLSARKLASLVAQAQTRYTTHKRRAHMHLCRHAAFWYSTRACSTSHVLYVTRPPCRRASVGLAVHRYSHGSRTPVLTLTRLQTQTGANSH